MQIFQNESCFKVFYNNGERTMILDFLLVPQASLVARLSGDKISGFPRERGIVWHCYNW